MNKFTAGILTAAMIAALGSATAAPQGYDKAEVAFKAAYEKEAVDGDLKGAITQYEKLARGSNRAMAAKALVRIGQCQEKLGSAEARKAYERVVREYGDQEEAVAEARRRPGAKSRTVGVGARRIERAMGDVRLPEIANPVAGLELEVAQRRLLSQIPPRCGCLRRARARRSPR